MNNLGNDAATATLRMGEKSIEAIFKLLKFMAERDERELKKLQLDNLKNELNKKQASEFLNQHRGFVNYKKLAASGEKLYVTGISISPKNMKRFQEYAELHGLVYSTIEDKRITNQIKDYSIELRELEEKKGSTGITTEEQDRMAFLNNELEILNNQKQDKLIVVRDSELDILKDVCDRLNLDISLEQNSSRATMEKTDINIEEIDVDMENEKSIKDYFSKLNERSLTFERAATSVTGMGERDKPIYIVDLNDEEKYIKVFSESGIKEDGKEYVITRYDICNHGDHPICTTWEHGRFEHWSDGKGENKTNTGINQWRKMKQEMCEKGCFSENVYIFQTEQSFEQFRQSMKMVREKEMKEEPSFFKEDVNMEYIDCSQMIRELDHIRSTGVLILNEDEKEILSKRIKAYQDIHELQNNVYLLKSEKNSTIADLKNDGVGTEKIKLKEEEFDTKISKLAEKLEKKKEQSEKLAVRFQKMRAKSIANNAEKGKDNISNSKFKNREEWEKATNAKREARESLPHREEVANVKNVVNKNKDGIDLGR